MKEHPHGTTKKYHQGCRCEECLVVMRAYWREKRRNRNITGPIPHGTCNGYTNYSCRCDACLAAWQSTYDYQREYRETHRAQLREKRKKYYHEVAKPKRQAEEAERRRKRNEK